MKTILSATAAAALCASVFAASAAAGNNRVSVNVQAYVPIRCQLDFQPSFDASPLSGSVELGRMTGFCNLPHSVSVSHDPVEPTGSTLRYENNAAPVRGAQTAFANLEPLRRYETELWLDVGDTTAAVPRIHAVTVIPAG